ncbi:hypothetical protein [Streptomyces lasalocidi]|uniref:Uncharacterized protein n=1 Tax=Streptomyces lasalocidi TaxID=324833 RepID=A0A4U5W4F4_STRLS|nr:hypothetical protein [Streptomyces lasalocidi]TKS96316.1 hypothetical protein E4U91_37205 [Streptomyces lasalocidi]
MSAVRLADLTIVWTGTDSVTPAGHVLVHGVDSTGLHRLCLYAGDTPNDDAYRGHLLIPPDNHGQRYLPTRTTAYGPGGAYVSSIGDHTAMLARLANRDAK